MYVLHLTVSTAISVLCYVSTVTCYVVQLGVILAHVGAKWPSHVEESWRRVDASWSEVASKRAQTPNKFFGSISSKLRSRVDGGGGGVPG